MVRVYLQTLIMHHLSKILLNVVHYDEQRGEGLWLSCDNDIVDFDRKYIFFDLA